MGTSRKRGLKLAIVFLVLTTLSVAWLRGRLGEGLARVLAATCFPRRIGAEVTISRWVLDGPIASPRSGAVLTLHPERLNRLLREAHPLSILIPPGTLRDRMAWIGAWTPDDDLLRDEGGLPWTIILDEAAPWRPHLAVRFPAADFNALVKEHFKEDFESREEWLLGHYDLIYKPTFETLNIYTTAEAPARPIRERTIRFEATGRVKLRLVENLFSTSTDGRIKPLSGVFRVGFEQHPDGIGITYKAEIQTLELSARRMAPWTEKLAADGLRRSLERSLNKRKRRKRLAETRLPPWVPLDTILVFHLTNEDRVP